MPYKVLYATDLNNMGGHIRMTTNKTGDVRELALNKLESDGYVLAQVYDDRDMKGHTFIFHKDA